MADILVAEDYPATRSVLRTLLRGAGHTVRFAVNGEEALAQVAQKRPDLLLLDVMMPKKSGYEVLGEIRRTDAALPVILLTAKGEKSDVVLGCWQFDLRVPLPFLLQPRAGLGWFLVEHPRA